MSKLSSFIQGQSSYGADDTDIQQQLRKIQNKGQQLQNKFVQIIEKQYHDIIVCDLSAIDPAIQQKITKLQQKSLKECMTIGQIGQIYQDNQMNIKLLKEKINMMGIQTQKNIKCIKQQSRIKHVQTQYLGINQILAKEEEDLKIKIQTKKLEELLQVKKMEQKAVFQFLKRQQQKENHKISQLFLDIQKEKSKDSSADVQFQLLNNQERGRLINDRKQSINLSISNMKKYIEINRQYS